MYCSKCKMDVGSVRFCPACGEKMSATKPAAPARKDRNNKIIAGSAALLIIALIVVAALSQSANSPGGASASRTNAQQATANKNYSRLMDKLPITQTVAEDILFALRAVGINEVPWQIESNKSGDVVFAYFVYENADIKLTINNNGCDSIAANNFNRIYSKTGQDKSTWARAQISNYTLTNDETSGYCETAYYAVLNVLKSPKSAEFANGFFACARRDNDVVRISSYVDAQNGFGSLLRAQFELEFNYPDAKKVKYFSFDGEVLIKDGEVVA